MLIATAAFVVGVYVVFQWLGASPFEFLVIYRELIVANPLSIIGYFLLGICLYALFLKALSKIRKDNKDYFKLEGLLLSGFLFSILILLILHFDGEILKPSTLDFRPGTLSLSQAVALTLCAFLSAYIAVPGSRDFLTSEFRILMRTSAAVVVVATTLGGIDFVYNSGLQFGQTIITIAMALEILSWLATGFVIYILLLMCEKFSPFYDSKTFVKLGLRIVVTLAASFLLFANGVIGTNSSVDVMSTAGLIFVSISVISEG